MCWGLVRFGKCNFGETGEDCVCVHLNLGYHLILPTQTNSSSQASSSCGERMGLSMIAMVQNEIVQSGFMC